MLAELDMLGIITTKVISKGRYGRTREICLGLPPALIQKTQEILNEGIHSS